MFFVFITHSRKQPLLSKRLFFVFLTTFLLSFFTKTNFCFSVLIFNNNNKNKKIKRIHSLTNTTFCFSEGIRKTNFFTKTKLSVIISPPLRSYTPYYQANQSLLILRESIHFSLTLLCILGLSVHLLSVHVHNRFLCLAKE